MFVLARVVNTIFHVKLETREQARQLDDELEPIDWAVIPEGVRRIEIFAPSGRLAGIEAGDPRHPRVVMVPGTTGSKEDFVRMMPTLVAHGFYAQSYDLAGQYESHLAGPENLTPARSRYDNELFVNDFIHVLENGSTPAHVLGYSFAGNVAQEAFARRPELFASLTLQSTPPVPGQAFARVKRIGWLSHVVNGSMGAGLMIWGVKSNVIPAPADRLEFVRARFALTRRESVAATISLMKKTPDHRSKLRERDIPKLVAVGHHDLWPVELHEVFARQIGAEFRTYAAGHSPCETTPHQLAWDMMDMIAATTRSA